MPHWPKIQVSQPVVALCFSLSLSIARSLSLCSTQHHAPLSHNYDLLLEDGHAFPSYEGSSDRTACNANPKRPMPGWGLDQQNACLSDSDSHSRPRRSRQVGLCHVSNTTPKHLRVNLRLTEPLLVTRESTAAVTGR